MNTARFSPMSKHRTLLALLALAPAALLAQTAEPAPASANPSELLKLEPVVVTGAQTRQPLVVTTDPKAPSQPVPAHDDGVHFRCGRSGH